MLMEELFVLILLHKKQEPHLVTVVVVVGSVAVIEVDLVAVVVALVEVIVVVAEVSVVVTVEASVQEEAVVDPEV